MTAAQRRVHDAILSGPRGVVEGPLRVWLRNPGLADTAQALGAYCRYGTALPPALSEFAILMMGAYWRAGFEWATHLPIALRAGVTPAKAEAIRTGARPADMTDGEQAVWDFADELLRQRRVADATYARARRQLGEAGLIDLVGILGYYTLISMTINAFAVPLPPGAADPFADGAAEC